MDTALTLAIKNGNLEFVEPIVEVGADVKYQGWNMLWHLAEKQDMTNLRTLLRAGFRVNLSQVFKWPVCSFSRATMKVNQDGPNVLKYLETFGKSANQEVATLLCAAGKTLDKDIVEVPDYLQQV